MKEKVLAIALIVLLVIIFSWLLSGRNDVVNAYEDVKFAEANVQTMLQRRNDLIPNLNCYILRGVDELETF